MCMMVRGGGGVRVGLDCFRDAWEAGANVTCVPSDHGEGVGSGALRIWGVVGRWYCGVGARVFV